MPNTYERRFWSYERRFWSKVDPCRTDGCALWLGTTNGAGYGQFEIDGKKTLAHHFLAGRAPIGMHKDHLCRVTNCVWPEHLEDVTPQENARRGAHGMLITHCPQGHEYSAQNTYIQSGGGRECRACHRERELNRKRRIRAAVLA